MKNRFYLLLIGLCFLGATALAENGKISGLVFYDYTADADQNTLDGFGLSRAYFTYENKISDALKFKFQTDIDYGNVPMNLYIKIAQVDWNTGYGKVTLGLQGMNTFSVQEKTWGLRYIEKSPMDLYKWASSADMGVGYSNTFQEKLHVSALFVNGAGYKKAETDSYKKTSAQVTFGETKLSANPGYNLGGVVTYEPYGYSANGGPRTKSSKTVLGIFGGVATQKFRAGGEFERFTDNGPETTAQLFSAYSEFHLTHNLQIFGRYDLLDPNSEVDQDRNSYLILGLSSTAVKGLTIAPNFRYTSYQAISDPDKLFKINFEFKVS